MKKSNTAILESLMSKESFDKVQNFIETFMEESEPDGEFEKRCFDLREYYQEQNGPISEDELSFLLMCIGFIMGQNVDGEEFEEFVKDDNPDE